LDAIYHRHPNYAHFRRNITEGVKYPADRLPEPERIALLDRAISKGNHPSTLTEDAKPIMDKLVHEDVRLAYGLPLTVDAIRRMPRAEVYPLNLQKQWTVNEAGDTIPKRRVTHNLSHRRSTKKSINQRIRLDEMEPCQYGFALRRVCHYMWYLRARFPTERILLAKTDMDKAYRRVHTWGHIAAACTAIYDGIAIPLLRLPFGSTPACSEFSQHSEAIFDLANDIFEDPAWNPTKVHSPNQHLLPPEHRLPDDEPFGTTAPLDVELPEMPPGKCDGYIDDGIQVVLDRPDLLARARAAMPLAIHCTFRPVADDEPIPRPDALSLRKLLGEGRFDELKIFLGWLLNSRAFRIALPANKVIAWSKEILVTLKADLVHHDGLEPLVGKLNHLGHVIPAARHFLNRIRTALRRARTKPTVLLRQEREDLKLWVLFLQQAGKGISINNVVFRRPDIIVWSDASELGIGGYSNSGIGWRFKLPPHLVGVFTLNLLEFIAAVITIELVLDHAPPGTCILGLADSTCTVGWLYKSSFDVETHSVHCDVSRRCGRGVLQNHACLYSQHVGGSKNVVADSLSRDFHLTDDELTFIYFHFCSDQIPASFRISPLTAEHASWLSLLGRMRPGPWESNKAPTTSELLRGAVGKSFSETSASAIRTWINSRPTTASASSEPSCTPCGKGLGIREVESRWQLTPPERPLTTYVRPSRQVVGADSTTASTPT